MSSQLGMAGAGAGNLIPEQLDRAVEYSVVVLLENTLFLVIDQANRLPAILPTSVKRYRKSGAQC